MNRDLTKNCPDKAFERLCQSSFFDNILCMNLIQRGFCQSRRKRDKRVIRKPARDRESIEKCIMSVKKVSVVLDQYSKG
jgi:hypothetical protein